MDPQTQLKQLAPMLDPHLLLHLLSKNAKEDSAALQTQLKARFLNAKPDVAKKAEEEAKEKAAKLITLLSEATKCENMRKEKEFNLQHMSAKEGITVADCQHLFNYAKILYDQQKYPGKSITG